MAKKDKALTYEEVDEHVNRLEKQEKAMLSTPPDAGQICQAYKSVRPLLLFATSFAFLPPSWKNVIKNYMTTCDQFCP